MWPFQEIAKMGPCRSWVGDRPLVAQATGDRDLSVIFFRIFSSNRSLAGDVVQGGRSPPQRAIGGPIAPPPGDRAGLPYLNPLPSHPSFYSLKFQKK